MEWLRDLGLRVEDLTPYGGVGIVSAALLLLLGRLFVPREERRALRLPFVLLVLHVALMVAHAFVPERAAGRDAVRLVALLVLLLSIGRAGFLVVLHSVFARKLARPLPRIFRDIVQATIYAAALIVTLRAAGVEPGSLLTTSALITAVVGLSLQDTLGNLFAGLAIQAQRPFEVGDWIQFDTDEANIGMVVEVNWRAAKVLTIEQVEVTVPNSQLAKQAIRNFTKPLPESRRSVSCHAPYHIPVRRVQSYVLDSIRDVDGVLADPEPSMIPRAFDERGVQYEVRYFVRDFHRRDVIAGDVRDRVWYALSRAAIEIPVPQRLIQLRDASTAAAERERAAELERRADHLRAVDFLEDLPDAAVHKLAEMSETRLYDKHENIIRQGEEGQELFILRRGKVAVLLEGKDGERELARIEPGAFFGEMSLMTGERRSASVRALEETEVLVLGKDAFHRVFVDHPDVVDRISDVLAARAEAIDRAAEVSGPVEQSEHGERQKVLLQRIRRFFSL